MSSIRRPRNTPLKKAGKIIIGGTALVIVILIIIGLVAPREFRGTIVGTVPKSPAEVYRWLTDFEDIPNRRPEIHAIEMGSDNEQGLPVWTEFHGNKSSIFQAIEMVPNERLSVQTVTSNFGLSGTWSYALSPAASGHGTNVTITEVSDAYNFISRVMFTVLGRKHTIRTELKAIERWADGH